MTQGAQSLCQLVHFVLIFFCWEFDICSRMYTMRRFEVLQNYDHKSIIVISGSFVIIVERI